MFFGHTDMSTSSAVTTCDSDDKIDSLDSYDSYDSYAAAHLHCSSSTVNHDNSHSNVSVVCDATSILSEMILHNFVNGVHASLFSDDISVLKCSMSLHGLTVSGLDLKQSQTALYVMFFLVIACCMNLTWMD